MMTGEEVGAQMEGWHDRCPAPNLTTSRSVRARLLLLPGRILTDVCLAPFRCNRLGSEDEPAVQSEMMLALETFLKMLLCSVPYSSQSPNSVALRSRIPGKLVIWSLRCTSCLLQHRAKEKVSAHVCAQWAPTDICGSGLAKY